MKINILLQAATGLNIGQLLPIGLIAIVFYFFLIRPQVKKQKDQKTKGEARPFLQKEDREDHRKDRGRVIEHDRETEFEFCNRVEIC